MPPGAGKCKPLALKASHILARPATTPRARAAETGQKRIPIILKLLSYFGRRAGWCIRNPDTAFLYLTRWDFFVLCSGGSPVVAVHGRPESAHPGARFVIDDVHGISNCDVLRNPAVDLLIASLEGVSSPLRKEDLRTGSDLSSLDRDGWSSVLEAVPFAIQHAPATVRNAKGIREKIKTSLLRYVHRDPFWIHVLIGMISGGMSLTENDISPLESALRHTALPVKHCKRWLFRNARLRAAWEEGWMMHLKSKVTTRGVPRRLLASPKNRQLVLSAVERDLAGEQVPGVFHRFLRDEPGLFEAWRQAWIRNVQGTCSGNEPVPMQLWEDRPFMHAWVSAHSAAADQGIGPAHIPGAGTLLHAACCSLWITAVKVLFKKHGPGLRGLRIPKPLRKIPEIRRTLLEAWITHLKARATTCGVPRRVLALPEVRPLALNAFLLDLAYSQPPPPFHTFYSEEPGLRDAWIQAWKRYVSQAPRAAAEVPASLLRDKKMVSAWFRPHLLDCKRGKLPEAVPMEGLPRSLWIALWRISIKAVFTAPGNAAQHVAVPPDVLRLPSIQRTVIKGWLACLENEMKEDAAGRPNLLAHNLFFRVLGQIYEVPDSAQALRDFVFGYLRLAARWNRCPCFQTLSAQSEDPLTQHVLQELSGDSEFRSLWKNAWRNAAIEHISRLANAKIWLFLILPEEIVVLPEVRSTARQAYIAFLGRSNGASDCAPARGTVDPAQEALASSTKPGPDTQLLCYAEKTVDAVLERFAFDEDLAGADTPPETLAPDSELCRQWSELWPRRLAERIPLETKLLAAGCTEIGLPAEVWKQPWGLRLKREIVLRFLSLRGAGRPLAANDSLPQPFASDPEMREAWVAAWERVLHAQPQRYAVFRRVALNVQHSPRVFRAWLQAVRPLNRLSGEEDAWRTFLLLNRGDAFPPFLPRLEIWQRNSRLRNDVRKALQHWSALQPAGGGDFITHGVNFRRERAPDAQAGHAIARPEDAALFHDAFAISAQESSPGPIDARDMGHLTKATDALRAAPWILESLPPEYGRHRVFLDAALSGWEDYLGAAPWLLAWIPAGCREQFKKTRSGVKRSTPPPTPAPRKRLPSAA